MEEKPNPLHKIKHRSSFLDYSEMPDEVKEIFENEKDRSELRKDLHDATFLNGTISLEENKGITVLIDSRDKESIYLARAIIKGKTSSDDK